jgi:lipopolysaccharide transport system ATP-binding protein
VTGEPAVLFERVWKKFRRGERHDSLRDLIPSLVKRLVRPTPPEDLSREEFWAIENVDFEVKPGEALGIIGPNGAGKSTSLKLLTRILRPNRGRCRVKGRIGALIEVAAGFHPDLTGRENIFLQGAIMGMKRVEVIRKLDEIVEFAGIGEFIDTQVKRYSSGMNARLGFAIAAHLDPDVLIIDEVLSVGDAAFQQKCVQRMFAFKRQGVAIVFVSHNLQAVSDLCDQVLFLRRKAEFLGPTAAGINAYIRSVSAVGSTGQRPVRISAILLNQTGDPAPEIVPPGQPLRLRVTYSSSIDLSDFLVAFIMKRTTDQLLVYDGQFSASELGVSQLRVGQDLVIDYDFTPNLTRGQYHVECHMVDQSNQQFVGWLAPAGLLAVDERRTWGGVADLSVRPRVKGGEDHVVTGWNPPAATGWNPPTE